MQEAAFETVQLAANAVNAGLNYEQTKRLFDSISDPSIRLDVSTALNTLRDNATRKLAELRTKTSALDENKLQINEEQLTRMLGLAKGVIADSLKEKLTEAQRDKTLFAEMRSLETQVNSLTQLSQQVAKARVKADYDQIEKQVDAALTPHDAYWLRRNELAPRHESLLTRRDELETDRSLLLDTLRPKQNAFGGLTKAIKSKVGKFQTDLGEQWENQRRQKDIELERNAYTTKNTAFTSRNDDLKFKEELLDEEQSRINRLTAKLLAKQGLKLWDNLGADLPPPQTPRPQQTQRSNTLPPGASLARAEQVRLKRLQNMPQRSNSAPPLFNSPSTDSLPQYSPPLNTPQPRTGVPPFSPPAYEGITRTDSPLSFAPPSPSVDSSPAFSNLVSPINAVPLRSNSAPPRTEPHSAPNPEFAAFATRYQGMMRTLAVRTGIDPMSKDVKPTALECQALHKAFHAIGPGKDINAFFRAQFDEKLNTLKNMREQGAELPTIAAPTRFNGSRKGR